MTSSTDIHVHTHSVERGRGTDWTRYLVPLGRLCFTAIFFYSVPGHFSAASIGYAAQQGVPDAGLLVPLSGLVELAGALMLLFGFHARMGALLLALFLLPVTLMMHRFWIVQDPMMATMQRVMFLKNVSMFGAALLFMYFGAGPFSVDARARRV